MGQGEARAIIANILVKLELVESAQCEAFLQAVDSDIELASLDIDSMKVIDLLVELEEQLGREIAVEEVIENPTVNQLADHLAKTAA